MKPIEEIAEKLADQVFGTLAPNEVDYFLTSKRQDLINKLLLLWKELNPSPPSDKLNEDKLSQAVRTFLDGVHYVITEESANYVVTPEDVKMLLDALNNSTSQRWIPVAERLSQEFKEGDWVAYNWLDDDGNDNWKIGRIVKTEHNGLMYLNNDGTERSGYMPITDGIKLLTN